MCDSRGEHQDEILILLVALPGYQIFWRNRWINVFRPDVQCTNGIIHVIDYPLVEDNDVMVTKGSMYSASPINGMSTVLMLLPVALVSAVSRWF